METNDTPEIALEREKLQIERERLALERERLETERENYKHTVSLSNRAAGRMTMPISTLILSLAIMLLIGGMAGMWLSSRVAGDEVLTGPSVLRVLDADDGTGSTNELGSAASPLIRALNRRGRQSGYLLILD